ncbi:LOW QUALITY PROTEIN: hypothetical protein BDA96_10G010300 [Sorghum bicolor]|uniref:Uncharacterized protein n=1 Tax=Sorghum bicolor TaxID=4558 RepID=A0A921PYZ7_SORBI|nr:LOW QUALITY PROTEIN: hypothetical protein BDA96_10G010300 [Sorghum bicolor]
MASGVPASEDAPEAFHLLQATRWEKTFTESTVSALPALNCPHGFPSSPSSHRICGSELGASPLHPSHQRIVPWHAVGVGKSESSTAIRPGWLFSASASSPLLFLVSWSCISASVISTLSGFFAAGGEGKRAGGSASGGGRTSAARNVRREEGQMRRYPTYLRSNSWRRRHPAQAVQKVPGGGARLVGLGGATERLLGGVGGGGVVRGVVGADAEGLDERLEVAAELGGGERCSLASRLSQRRASPPISLWPRAASAAARPSSSRPTTVGAAAPSWLARTPPATTTATSSSSPETGAAAATSSTPTAASSPRAHAQHGGTAARRHGVLSARPDGPRAVPWAGGQARARQRHGTASTVARTTPRRAGTARWPSMRGGVGEEHVGGGDHHRGARAGWVQAGGPEGVPARGREPARGELRLGQRQEVLGLGRGFGPWRWAARRAGGSPAAIIGGEGRRPGFFF